MGSRLHPSESTDSSLETNHLMKRTKSEMKQLKGFFNWIEVNVDYLAVVLALVLTEVLTDGMVERLAANI